MKNKLIFEGSGLSKKQKQRVLEVLAQTPEDFGFMAADDDVGGFLVGLLVGQLHRRAEAHHVAKFRVEVQKPESLRNTSITNSLIFIPLINADFLIKGFYESDDSPSGSKHFYLDSEKNKEVSSDTVGLYGWQTFLNIKIQTKGKTLMPYYFKIGIPFEKLFP